MAIALVASAFLINKTVGGGGTGGTTGAVDSTGATLLTATFGGFPSPAAGTDSMGNTWTTAVTATTFWLSYIQYCNNPTVGSGHTFNGSGTYTDFQFAAWSGTDTTSPLDVVNHKNGNAGSLQPGLVTPAVPASLILSHIIYDAGYGATTIDSGFTMIDTGDGGGLGGGAYGGAYLFPDTAAVNPTWGNGGSGNWVTTIAVFKAAAATAVSGKKLPILGTGLTQLIAFRAAHMALTNPEPTRRELLTLTGKGPGDTARSRDE